MWVVAYLIYTILIKLWNERFIIMGLFFDSYDDCIAKYDSCIRAGDNSGAEASLLKAFNKDHDANEDGALYYLLSLVQFEQGKDDIAYDNMENSADLDFPDAVDLISEANEDDGMNLKEIIKATAGLLTIVNGIINMLSA